MTQKPAKNPVGTLEKAFSIVETVSRERGATIDELDRQLPYAKSTIHRHLSTLRQEGYVIKNGFVYDISYKFFNVASYRREYDPLYQIGRSITDETSNRAQERTSLIVEERSRAVKCYISESEQSVVTDAHPGLSMYMHCVSGGKAILAHLSEERVKAVVDAVGLPKMTDNTITDREQLLSELRDVRENGVAVDDQERITGIRGVAAPVIDDRTDEVLGSIDITGPTTRVEGEKFRSDLPDLARRAAAEIANNIHYLRDH